MPLCRVEEGFCYVFQGTLDCYRRQDFRNIFSLRSGSRWVRFFRYILDSSCVSILMSNGCEILRLKMMFMNVGFSI